MDKEIDEGFEDDASVCPDISPIDTDPLDDLPCVSSDGSDEEQSLEVISATSCRTKGSQ